MEKQWKILSYFFEQVKHADSKTQSMQILGGIVLTGLLAVGGALSNLGEEQHFSSLLISVFCSSVAMLIIFFIFTIKSYWPKTKKIT